MKKETRLIILSIVCVAIMAIVFYFALIKPMSDHKETRLTALDRFQQTDWAFPEDTSIDWNYTLYPIHSGDGHWWKTQVYIYFENEPWNNTAWMLWLNFLNGDKHIEP